MNDTTSKRNRLKQTLKSLLQNHSDAQEVKHRYRLMRAVLLEEYPNAVGDIEKDKFIEMLKDIIYVDRQIRKETEGKDEETKKILSQEKIIELGYLS